jgi:hypothetical protein
MVFILLARLVLKKIVRARFGVCELFLINLIGYQEGRQFDTKTQRVFAASLLLGGLVPAGL